MVLLFCPAHYAIFFHLSILALNNVDWLKAWVCVAPEAIHLEFVAVKLGAKYQGNRNKFNFQVYKACNLH